MAKVLSHPDGKVALGGYADSIDLATGLNKDVPGLLAGLEKFSEPSVKEPAFAIVFWLGYDDFRFPAAQCKALWARGIVPVLMIMPGWERQVTDQRHSLEAIIAGELDGTIRRAANEASLADADQYPLLVSFGWEVNNIWQWAWAYDRSDGPTLYRQAYRRWVEVTRSEAGDCWSWLWMTGVNPEGAPRWNDSVHWYPGHDVVDWVGIGAHRNLGTFEVEMNRAVAELTPISGLRDKHLIVELSATVDGSTFGARPTSPADALFRGRRANLRRGTRSLPVVSPEDKREYIEQSLYHLGHGSWPWPVSAASWWNGTEWNPTGGVDSSVECRDAWRWGLMSPQFTSHVRTSA